MKRINQQSTDFDTPIQLEVTLRELLNICAAVASIAPNEVIEYLKEHFDISPSMAEEIKKSPISYYKDGNNMDEHLVLYGLSYEAKSILKDFGYKYKI